MPVNPDFRGAPFQPIELATVDALVKGVEVDVLAIIQQLGEIQNRRVLLTGAPFATLEITLLDDSTRGASGVSKFFHIS